MDRLQAAIGALHEADAEAGRRKGQDRLHPAARLIVCMGFLAVTMSFGKYDLSGLLSMSLYLVVTGIWEEISLWRGFFRLRYMICAVFLLGAANVFFDRNVIFYIGSFRVTGGMLSMATLSVKGIFAVYAAYFLLLTVGINRLCMTLRRAGIPKGIVTVLLLTYRYLIVLLKEGQRMIQAYELRAPGHRGIHVRVWGSFAGLLLLRSVDRAGEVYNSMLLRGYDGEFAYEAAGKGTGISFLYAAAWLCVFALLRNVPVFRLAGGLL